MNDPKYPALYVLHASGVAETLVSFVTNMDVENSEPLEPFSRLGALALLKANRRCEAALANIQRNINQGEMIQASDVLDLMPHHLLAIKQQGDMYLYTLIESMNEEGSDPNGRERERSSEWDDICCFRGRTTRSIPCNKQSPDCPFRPEIEKDLDLSFKRRGGYSFDR